MIQLESVFVQNQSVQRKNVHIVDNHLKLVKNKYINY